METSAPVAGPVSVRALGWASAGFLASLGLLLMTVVETRRAFLFPLSDYLKLGGPSPILYFDPRHLPLLALGSLGAWLSYRYLSRLEGDLRGKGMDLTRLTRLLGVGLLGILILDLFVYRGVPASRILAAGRTGVGQAIPLELFASWLRPLGEGINYMALVWHATILGVLIGALFLVLVAPLLRGWMGGAGFRSHLAGATLALGHPFCSCCAAPIGAGLFRGGAALGPTLAFVVSSPMLNLTSLVLAVSLLPLDLALLRVIGGLAVGILVTYLVSTMAIAWAGKATTAAPHKAAEWSSRLLDAFNRWFRFEVFLGGKVADSPGGLIETWLGMAWRLGRVVVPVLLFGSVVTSAVVSFLPAPTDGLPGILAAAALGTLLMAPTWTELPVALGLLQGGMAGPAAALLITMPAVSVPCLVIIGAATANYRAAILLGSFVFATGVLAGVWFSVL